MASYKIPAGPPSDNVPDRSSSSGMLLNSRYSPHILIFSAGARRYVYSSKRSRTRHKQTSHQSTTSTFSFVFITKRSSSPEQGPTFRLTPRVDSSVAMHNTLGIMFAQPARRIRRPPARTFRHQTNSFSFDSSERASAAYEQERVMSTSTDGSTTRPSGDLSLHEELRGSSLQGSRVTSGMSHAKSDALDEDLSTVRIRDESEHAASALRDFIFSSPQLPLPPPFSAVPGRVSGSDILPGIGHVFQVLQASPIRSSSTTPVRSGVAGRRPAPSSSPVAFEHVDRIDPSIPVSLSPRSLALTKSHVTHKVVNNISSRGLLRRAADSVVDIYRAHTPLSRQSSLTKPSPSISRSPTPRRYRRLQARRTAAVGRGDDHERDQLPATSYRSMPCARRSFGRLCNCRPASGR